ncbi:unnamed protein product [Pleuronectes platessa]|uniref:Uncharacterized protein n=1 Tax=Pleuronectes platessa TaxID=8262 RepID=A0A9N7UQ98_PLEPL|nr:unnamed protein product [Pleuronectes platessa]
MRPGVEKKRKLGVCLPTSLSMQEVSASSLAVGYFIRYAPSQSDRGGMKEESTENSLSTTNAKGQGQCQPTHHHPPLPWWDVLPLSLEVQCEHVVSWRTGKERLLVHNTSALPPPAPGKDVCSSATKQTEVPSN